MKALAIAATGMNAQQTNLEVIANNIANINTTGYKRARAEFSDLLYQVDRMQGVPNRANSAIVPEGVSIGLGVKTAAVRNVHIQGGLTNTGNEYDLALTGRGWFEIEGPEGQTLYTRAGSFNTSATGQLVTIDGYNVIPAITVPQNALEVIVNNTGEVFARVAGQTALQPIGQLQLANFANEAGLAPLGDNLFAETEASGAANVGAPGDPGFATVKQGYLENSNVDPVKEITELISAQRAYEMNSKVIQAADEMAAVVSKNIR
ncbi:MAG: flagellar basal-body rod protein FlgG [Proteobacteria bacterium]|jgi:flagellar basal-body rod protein FlgG|uniref:flagellar basal-body rod protein FlgG n=1 Tax=Hyphomicrobiales TaxID=356 RepID=UPI0003670159|nr:MULTISPECIES: flagellar basal-body rod protein FlgG [Phyllobacteriaceae]MCA0278178.1 flagellar basal-body rod protein FlgG [Pseudomonadota bacterium]MCX8569843.1 flagellar basal-body rod protein FlgG [Aminobacter sp. MET-1]